jgi:hypothetical protein
MTPAMELRKTEYALKYEVKWLLLFKNCPDIEISRCESNQ